MANSSYSPFKTKDYRSSADKLPENAHITVVHMLHFHSTAIYPPSSPYVSLEPVSGSDAFYQRYVPAGTAAARESGIKPAEARFFSASVTNLLLHNDVPWDVIAARRYGSFADYARYQDSKAYTETGVHHRDAALRDWSLFVCVEEGPPNT